MTRPIEHLDVPLATVKRQVVEIVARQRASQVLAEAAARTPSPSRKAAYQLDAWLIRHPDALVSVEADYPGWAAALAARNQRPLETS